MLVALVVDPGPIGNVVTLVVRRMGQITRVRSAGPDPRHTAHLATLLKDKGLLIWIW